MTTPLTTWRVDLPCKSRVVTDDDDRIIIAEDLSIQHARLIASAPALFAALTQLSGWVERAIVPQYTSRRPMPENCRLALEAARAALALAQPADGRAE